MSFNQKVIYTSFVILVLVFGYGASLYYKKTHPKYVPIPAREEVTLTIIPGWNLRQVAEYLVKMGFASSTDDVFKITGKPATVYDKFTFFGPSDDLIEQAPGGVTMEGYLAPETFRVFGDASLNEGIIDKFYFQRSKEITPAMYASAKESKRTMHQILTMASLLEKEAQTPADKAKVADILWRRLAKGWALQLDSTVHYAVDRTGDVFTTDKERDVESPWNTYKYPGLPPGPICNPGIESIKASLYPEKNNYWYFLAGKDGTIYYGRTLEEHNANKRYL